jgi:hypothetical protein
MSGLVALIINEIDTNQPSVVCLLAERLTRPDLHCSRIRFISPNQEFIVLKKMLKSITSLQTKGRKA